MSADMPTRGPAQIGYLPWILHRASAVALVPLLILHIGVQVYPQYGFTVVVTTGIYQLLLGVTLILIGVHAFLGIRSALIGSRLTDRQATTTTIAIGIVILSVIVFRSIM